MSAVVLLSSGLDSSVNFYEAHAQLGVKLALTFDYGQRAAAQEIRCAQALCNKFGVVHQVVDLKWFSCFSNSSLTQVQINIPVGTDVSIDDMQRSQVTAEKVWVPNRNGIFLNIAAGFAEGLGAEFVIPGFNREEAATFPDNSQEFILSLNQSFAYSTGNRVSVKCYTTEMNKTQIVRRGRELLVDFSLIWPCYFGDQNPCGHCESCQRFNRAIREA